MHASTSRAFEYAHQPPHTRFLSSGSDLAPPPGESAPPASARTHVGRAHRRAARRRPSLHRGHARP
eukprot:2472210-Prymnesium_polylepis.1